MQLPDTYLAVEDSRSGSIAIVPIEPDQPLDLAALLDQWIDAEYGGELVRDGELIPRLAGDGYAWIQTDGRPLDSVVVWESGGFYLREAQ